MNNKNMLKVDLLVQLRNSSRQNREVAARLGGEGGLGPRVHLLFRLSMYCSNPGFFGHKKLKADL